MFAKIPKSICSLLSWLSLIIKSFRSPPGRFLRSSRCSGERSSERLRTCSASIGFSTQRVGFFHDEIESPERVTILVIILPESLLTSRIIAHSVKNSIELLSQKWGFYGFC